MIDFDNDEKRNREGLNKKKKRIKYIL